MKRHYFKLGYRSDHGDWTPRLCFAGRPARPQEPSEGVVIAARPVELVEGPSRRRMAGLRGCFRPRSDRRLRRWLDKQARMTGLWFSKRWTARQIRERVNGKD